jgi:exopolysaccharide biosynthesis polyprenyl glycosylphosphotransferase
MDRFSKGSTVVASTAITAEAPTELRPRLGQILHRPDGPTPAATKSGRGYRMRRWLLAADVTALICAFAAAQLYGGWTQANAPFTWKDAALIGVGVPLWVMFAQAHKLYHVDTRRADHGTAEEFGPILQMVTLWSWCILMLWTLSGLGPVVIYKLLIFWGLSIALLIAARSAVRFWARRQTWYVHNALIVGDGHQAGAIVRRILRHPEYGINVVACIDLSDEGSPFVRDSVGHIAHIPVINEDVGLVELVSMLDVERVIFTPSVSSAEHRAGLVAELSSLDIHIDLVPSWCDLVGARLDLHQMEGVPLLTVPYTKLGGSALLFKRVLDFGLSAAALLVLLPLFTLCAIAIKFDSRGPVFFRQRRVGKHDQCFELFKFRSMFVDAEDRKDEVAQLNFHGGGNAEGMFKIREDPRVTRVGRLLRRYSLDELPQLINVLRGDMSLVGPRPLIEVEDKQVEGRFRRRLSLTPGVTGLWQVNGRSEIPFDEMVNLDYLYVTSWSLWGDVKLLMKTFTAVFRGSGAY